MKSSCRLGNCRLRTSCMLSVPRLGSFADHTRGVIAMHPEARRVNVTFSVIFGGHFCHFRCMARRDNIRHCGVETFVPGRPRGRAPAAGALDSEQARRNLRLEEHLLALVLIFHGREARETISWAREGGVHTASHHHLLPGAARHARGRHTPA